MNGLCVTVMVLFRVPARGSSAAPRPGLPVGLRLGARCYPGRHRDCYTVGYHCASAPVGRARPVFRRRAAAGSGRSKSPRSCGPGSESQDGVVVAVGPSQRLSRISLPPGPGPRAPQGSGAHKFCSLRHTVPSEISDVRKFHTDHGSGPHPFPDPRFEWMLSQNRDT